MAELKDILAIREWLETQEDGMWPLSHKAAIIRSCDPFGLAADFRDKDGTIYEYFNGELQYITRGESRTYVGEGNWPRNI